MRLDLFEDTKSQFDRGAPRYKEIIWMLFGSFLLSSGLPRLWWRAKLLRLFGAKVGKGVVIKAGVRVKFPWRLRIGDYCWIGEGVWIENLADVVIGSQCSISQDVYLCTGSHDWGAKAFDLITRPIRIEDHVWLCAKSVVGLGVTVQEGAILTLGSVAYKDMDAWTIYTGTPASAVKMRVLTQR